MKCGIGRLDFNEKGKYFGNFQHGKRHGEGIFTYPNKDVYSGMWKYGKKSGQGVYVYNDTGIKLMGEWTDGVIKKGRWILPNGVYYEGEFENNKPTKTGILKSHFLRADLVI